jgi:succinoglycan biosynthesis transport protein ExoP
VQRDSNGFNIERVLRVLHRQAPWIVLCCVVAMGTAFGFSKHETKKYTATTSLVFDNNQLSQQVAGLQAINNSSNQQAQQNTNLKLVQTGDMAEKTAGQLGQGLTEEDISADLSVSAEGESNIVNVAATASSPKLAAGIANTYAAQFVSEQQNSNHTYYAAALALVNKQLGALSPTQRISAAGVALENRAQSLGVLAELHNGNVQVSRIAKVPKSPSSPRVARDTVLGAVLGLLLGLGIAFLLERLDQRIREPKDLEAVYGLPLLGVVPESSALSRSAGGGAAGSAAALPPGEVEAFQLIRAHLRYFNVDRELRTLLVASAAPGDGKTTIARHLAGAAARVGSRVLLLEADLRRPTLAQQLDVPSGPGVADVLIGAVPWSEAIQSVDVGLLSGGGTGTRALDVIVAGATLPPNPGELIESRAMGTLLERAQSAYDLVVIDTPPLTAVSDAFSLLCKVDGVIIVGRVGRNRRDVAERLHETLTGAGAPLLGVIANGFKAGRAGTYGYAYDYSYTEEDQTKMLAVGASPSRNGATTSEQPISTAKV